MATKRKLLEPIHPGEILLEDFMNPMDVSINRLARDIVVPPGRVSAIVNGKRAISADTALRLGKYFGVSPEVWMGLQADYDLRLAQRDIGDEVERRVQHPQPEFYRILIATPAAAGNRRRGRIPPALPRYRSPR